MAHQGVEEPLNTEKLTITKFQLFFVLIQSQIGIGLLSLPNVVSKSAEGDGWISIILAGVLIQGLLVIYYLLLKKYPNDTLAKINQKILGHMFGKVVNFILYIYFILAGSVSLILTVKTINAYLLVETPGWVISFLILSVCIYLAISDLRIIARFFVLVSSLLILLGILIVLSLFIPKEIHFILPIWDAGVKNILVGSNGALHSMLGFEMLLFIFPYVIQNSKGVLKTITFSNLFVISFYTIITFICLITFSADQLQQIKDPVLYLFRGLSSKTFNRLDFIFLSLWIVPMTTSIIAVLFLASKSMSVTKKPYKKIVVISGIVLFLMSLIPPTEDNIAFLTKYLGYLDYSIIIFLPVFLLILTLLFNRHERREEA